MIPGPTEVLYPWLVESPRPEGGALCFSIELGPDPFYEYIKRASSTAPDPSCAPFPCTGKGIVEPLVEIDHSGVSGMNRGTGPAFPATNKRPDTEDAG